MSDLRLVTNVLNENFIIISNNLLSLINNGKVFEELKFNSYEFNHFFTKAIHLKIIVPNTIVKLISSTYSGINSYV